MRRLQKDLNSDHENLAWEQFEEISQQLSSHAIIRLDLDGKILSWNQGAENILKWSSKEVLGKFGSIIFTPEDLNQKIDKMEFQTAIQFGKASDEHWHLKKDGSLFFASGTLYSIKNDSQQVCGFLKIIKDVTEQIKTRRKIEESEHVLRQLAETLFEEREIRERFVATLTHDLRTPLTAAKMCAEMILKNKIDYMKSTSFITRIIHNLDRIDIMIRNLLDVNRINAGEKLPFEPSFCELKELINKTLGNLATVHGDRFVFNATKEIFGYFDCNGIQRIVENLTNNAIKYGSSDHPVTVNLDESDSDILISVHNWGQPIPHEELQHLFSPYKRATRAQQGTQKGWGLGLTVVRGIIEAQGGHIEIESSSSTGTTFRVKFPFPLPFSSSVDRSESL